MEHQTHSAFLGLGSNLGDRKANIERAIQGLRQTDTQVTQVSPVYKTEPVEFIQQEWFLNQVVRIATRLGPVALLGLCQSIEASLGRQRTIPKGPRSIDLDILLYDDLNLSEPNLIIPHPRLHMRRFVLVPLSDIAQDLVHPVFQRSIGKLLEQCPDRAEVSLYVESPV